MDSLKNNPTYDLYLDTLKRYNEIRSIYSNMESLWRNKNMNDKTFQIYKDRYLAAQEDLKKAITLFSDEEKELIIYQLLHLYK